MFRIGFVRKNKARRSCCDARLSHAESTFERADPCCHSMPFLLELPNQFGSAKAFPALAAKRGALA